MKSWRLRMALARKADIGPELAKACQLIIHKLLAEALIRAADKAVARYPLKKESRYANRAVDIKGFLAMDTWCTLGVVEGKIDQRAVMANFNCKTYRDLELRVNPTIPLPQRLTKNDNYKPEWQERRVLKKRIQGKKVWWHSIPTYIVQQEIDELKKSRSQQKLSKQQAKRLKNLRFRLNKRRRRVAVLES